MATEQRLPDGAQGRGYSLQLTVPFGIPRVMGVTGCPVDCSAFLTSLDKICYHNNGCRVFIISLIWQVVPAFKPIMINADQFRLLSVQAVVYLANPEDFSQSKILSAILSSYSERYNGDVQALPLSGDIPLEFPRIVLQSAPSGWELRASPSRIDSLWSRLNLGDEEPNDVIGQCAEVLENYVRNTNLRIGRVALVLSRFTQVDNATHELATHFCNEQTLAGPLKRSDNFELHNFKAYQPETLDLKLNSWVRCKSGKFLPIGASVVVIEQDLNTIEGDKATNSFSADDLHNYFENAAREADQILRVYFPTGEQQ